MADLEVMFGWAPLGFQTPNTTNIASFYVGDISGEILGKGGVLAGSRQCRNVKPQTAGPGSRCVFRTPNLKCEQSTKHVISGLPLQFAGGVGT